MISRLGVLALILSSLITPVRASSTVLDSGLKGQSSSPVPPIESARRAIVVGVSSYPKSQVEGLRYASRDATEVASSLSSRGFGVSLLVDQTATGASILHEIQSAVATAREHETLLIYFAGHGTSDFSGSVLFPSDADPAQPATGLAWQQILDTLNNSRAQDIVVILDACRSATGSGAFSFGPSRSSGRVHVLYSTATGGNSYEYDELGHGVFTQFLLRGMAGAAADREGNVTFQRLTDYVSQNVSTYSLSRGNLQVPHSSVSSAADVLLFSRSLASATSRTRQLGATASENGGNPVSLPLANRVFGVVPVLDAVPEHSLDQVLSNEGVVYDSSIAILTLIAGSQQDTIGARAVANSFVVLTRDYQGDPIPVKPNGSGGCMGRDINPDRKRQLRPPGFGVVAPAPNRYTRYRHASDDFCDAAFDLVGKGDAISSMPAGRGVHQHFQIRVPTIANLMPSPVSAGAAQTLTIQGSGFQSGFMTNIEGAQGVNITSTQLNLQVAVGGGAYTIQVFNPLSGTGRPRTEKEFRKRREISSAEILAAVQMLDLGVKTEDPRFFAMLCTAYPESKQCEMANWVMAGQSQVGYARGLGVKPSAVDKSGDESLVQLKLSTLIAFCITALAALLAALAGYHQLFLRTLLERATIQKPLVTLK